ncbi:MAG: hypothetical protein AAFZ18_12065 [Myxococcota bacterium]
MMIRKQLRVALLLTFIGALLERATPAAAEDTMSATAAPAAPLDARRFEVTVQPKGEESWGDTLTFDRGTFVSEACSGYGFGPSAYATKRMGEALTFRVEARSESEGTSQWKGQVQKGSIEGTMVWTRPGQAPALYHFRGQQR